MPLLGVNVDHVASLRQARRGKEPDPVLAARLCEASGCHSIVAHLREDRRHIQDRDIGRLRECVRTKFNLEMALNPQIIAMAARLKPDQVTIVPERRQEITTEGGLDVIKNQGKIRRALEIFSDKKILVSLFVAPEPRQLKAAGALGVHMIELHTGQYAQASTASRRRKELKKLREATHLALNLGMIVNAGHGLDYQNTAALARIAGITELNIGHAIIARAVFVGLKTAVQEMLHLAQHS